MQSAEEVLEEILDEEDALGTDEGDDIDPYTGHPIVGAGQHGAEVRGYQHRAARYVQGHGRAPPLPPAVKSNAAPDDDDDELGFGIDSWGGLLLTVMCIAFLSALCVLRCMRSTIQQTSSRTPAEKLV